MRLTVKSLENQENKDFARIIKIFDNHVKKCGLDNFEQSLDRICLDTANSLGYEYTREKDDLIFTKNEIKQYYE